MDTNTLIIIIEASIALLLIFLVALIVINSQKKSAKLQMKLQSSAHQEHRELAQIALETQEKERQRIGMELHDSLGPSFVALRINMERIKQLISKGEYGKIKELADITENGINESIQTFSNVSRLLYPVILKRYGLEEAIKDIVHKFNNDSKTKFSLEYDVKCSLIDIKQLTIFRVCQELCNNASKHAEASNVMLHVNEFSQGITILFEDDGKGFDMSEVKEGIGLNSIRGRVGAVGGTLDYTSESNKGVKVIIRIPKDQNDQKD